MADVAAGNGLMGQFPLEQWFYEMPVVTRWWMTAALSVSVLVQCRIISPFQLFYSFRTVFVRSQVRRGLEKPSNKQTHYTCSTGASSPHSSTSARSISTFSTTYSSSSDIRASSKNRLAVRPPISPGSWHVLPGCSSALLLYFP